VVLDALAASFGMTRDPARRATVVAAIVDITAVPPGIAERVLDLRAWFLAHRTRLGAWISSLISSCTVRAFGR
jgi:hypothetical protein